MKKVTRDPAYILQNASGFYLNFASNSWGSYKDATPLSGELASQEANRMGPTVKAVKATLHRPATPWGAE